MARITNITNAILKTQSFPKLWKNALLLWSAKHTLFPQNHLSISLLSSLSKVVERVVLLTESEKSAKMPTSIPTFRSFSEHSCVQHTLKLNENILHPWFALFLDMEKAFDRFLHERHTYKLFSYNFQSGILRLTDPFLINRTLILWFCSSHR